MPHFTVYYNCCISQRDGLHVVPLPQIDKLIGQGLDLAIQAERGTAMSVSHLSDHYSLLQLLRQCLEFCGSMASFVNGLSQRS